MRCALHFARVAFDVIIWIAVVYFEFYLIVLALSMIREQPIRFFIFHVDTVPTGDPAAKMIFLVVVLLGILGFLALAIATIYFRPRYCKTKNTQNVNHSS